MTVEPCYNMKEKLHDSHKKKRIRKRIHIIIWATLSPPSFYSGCEDIHVVVNQSVRRESWTKEQWNSFIQDLEVAVAISADVLFLFVLSHHNEYPNSSRREVNIMSSDRSPTNLFKIQFLNSIFKFNF